MFLEQINSPEDLKKLTLSQLKPLAEEVRRFIIETVSKNGGHLASSLGTVELTIALHYVFDFKKDKLLWDVGHQCYAHKILTGRKDSFTSLRKADGISGFPNPQESIYDQFSVGHAGTSVATAVGMALGQGQVNGTDKVISLVGDASIVNGTSFEALNNLGLVKRQMLIVLNDNSMAIDATVGALAKYFSKLRLNQTYEEMVKTTNNILEHLPVIGKTVEEAIERIKKGIRMALPASQIFESLNIPYFGPVDGHDIDSLVQLFKELSHVNHPVLLHVYTRKGEGFAPAGSDPGKFHSTGPFEINGEAMDVETPDSGVSFTTELGLCLAELAEKDKKIVAITAAMCEGTGLGPFRQKFPGRFYDVGIAESVAVDIAAGLAKSGLKPVVCIYSTFLQRGFDHIFQDVAMQNLPVVFCVDRAGMVGADGPTHHGLMDIGMLRMMPNMVLTAPADAAEVKLALEFALNAGKPVVIRYPKDIVPRGSPATGEPFRLGKAVTIRKGKRSAIAIVSYGAALAEAVKAGELLAKEGIETDIVNARFAAPLDDEIVSLAGKGKAIITVEDHSTACGFGSAVLEAMTAAKVLKKPIITIGAPREFIKHDSRTRQLSYMGVSAEKIAQTAKTLIAKE